jgi:hypothetical protein
MFADLGPHALHTLPYLERIHLKSFGDFCGLWSGEKG